MVSQPSAPDRPIRTGELFTGGPQLDSVQESDLAKLKSPVGDSETDRGTITSQSFRVPAYSSADASLLTLLGDQASSELELATDVGRSHASVNSIDLLETVQSAIGESESVDVLFHRIAQIISESFDIGCALAIAGLGDEPIVASMHSTAELASAAGSWLGEMLQDHEVNIHLKTELNAIGYDQIQSARTGRTHPLLTSAPVPAAQLFPLASSGRWSGGLLLFDDIRLNLDAAANDAIKLVAHAVGLTVDEKFHPSEDSVRVDQWRGWARVMASILGGEPLTTVLRDVLAIFSDIVNVDGALVVIRDPGLPASERCVALGSQDFEKLTRSMVHSGAIDALIAPEMTLFAQTGANASADFAFDLSREYPTRLVNPIDSDDVHLGELCLYRASNQPYATEETDDARQFARVIAVTLQQRQMIQMRSRQDEVLTTARNLAESLNRSATQQSMAEIAVEVCARAFGTGMASLHFYQEQSERLVMAAAFGLPLPFVTANAHLPLGKGACGAAAEQRSLIIIEDVMADPNWSAEWHAKEDTLNFRSVWSVALMSGADSLLGTLTIYHAAAGPASDEEISFLRLLGHQIATALDRARLADRSQDLYRASVESLAAAVDAKDPFTHNHSWQVASYCRKIAEALGLAASEVEVIELAGLLHDVGKIGIPDRVLQKPAELAPDEWAMMQRHPDLGAGILGDNPALASVVPLVRHHHERYDGRGYPDQLSGDDIPLGAAIVGLADAFDTMTSDRPYRPARTVDQALLEIARASGSHFHPKVAEAFLDVVKSGGITPLTAAARRSATRELRLKRVVGSEARGFGLLQRITTEIGALVDLDRFLERLNELMSSEFPESVCEIYGQDPNNGDLVAIANQRRRKTLVVPRGQGIPGWVAAHGVSQNVRDVIEDERYIVTGHRLMRSMLAVPLVVDGHCAGVLSLEHPDAAAYSPSDQHVLEIVATYVAQAIQVANLHDRLKRNAHHDPLTGLLNHREFYQRLDDEIDRARMTAGKLAVAVLDVRELRVWNRLHGHSAGDDVLRNIADVLKVQIHNGDTVARYGGDEFAILVPRVTHAMIRTRLTTIAEALCDIRQQRPLPDVTWGIASFPSDGTQAVEIMAAAENDIRNGSLTRVRAQLI